MSYTTEQFFDLVHHTYTNHLHDSTGAWRYGQAYFNVLVQVNPSVAEQIRGTSMDPFYWGLDTDPSKWLALNEFVLSNWGDKGVEPPATL